MKVFSQILLILTLFLCSNQSWSQGTESLPKSIKRDGKVRFYVYHLNEFKDIQYIDPQNGLWMKEPHAEISYLFRSRDSNKMKLIDKRLIELADHLQDHFKVDTIEVISAFRTKDLQQELKDTGHKVASVEGSYHPKGQAFDIHIDEIKEETLWKYIKSLNIANVGFYGKNLMVHVSVGSLPGSYCSGEFFENTNVGVFNKDNSRKIRTDKFYYSKDELPKVTGMEGYRHVQIERFIRGKWLPFKEWPRGKLDLTKWKTLATQKDKYFKEGYLFGKWRLVFKYKEKDWQNSNEFYFKKL